MKIKINYVIILLCLYISTYSWSNNIDSLGLEVKKGKWVVSHKVDPGETMFSISQRYDAEIDAIMKVNDISDYSITVGSILYVPYPTAGKTEMHEVKEGETLFSLSRLYDASVSEIMKWNGMESYDLSVGQQVKVYLPPSESDSVPEDEEGVHTVLAGETLYSISRSYDVSVEELKAWNNLSGSEVSQGQKLKVSGPALAATSAAVIVSENEQPTTTEVNNEMDTQTIPPPPFIMPDNPKVDMLQKQLEYGMAELIEGTSDSNKFLALHKNAENGTVLCVENELNHQAVFVRVVGKIPQTSENDRVVVKLSKAAYDQLDAVNPRFRVVVTSLKSTN